MSLATRSKAEHEETRRCGEGCRRMTATAAGSAIMDSRGMGGSSAGDRYSLWLGTTLVNGLELLFLPGMTI
jgi:hypothetical protein